MNNPILTSMSLSFDQRMLMANRGWDLGLSGSKKIKSTTLVKAQALYKNMNQTFHLHLESFSGLERKIQPAILHSIAYRVKFGSYLKLYYWICWPKPSPWHKMQGNIANAIIKCLASYPKDLIKIMLKVTTINNRFQGHRSSLLLEEYHM